MVGDNFCHKSKVLFMLDVCTMYINNWMQHLAKNCRRTEGKFTERGKCRSEKGGGSEDTFSHVLL